MKSQVGSLLAYFCLILLAGACVDEGYYDLATVCFGVALFWLAFLFHLLVEATRKAKEKPEGKG